MDAVHVLPLKQQQQALDEDHREDLRIVGCRQSRHASSAAESRAKSHARDATDPNAS